MTANVLNLNSKTEFLLTGL